MNPYGLLKINHKKEKTNSLSNTQIFANANLSSNNLESTFNFDLKNEFSTNNLSNLYNQGTNLNYNYNNKNNFTANRDSENKYNRNSYNKTLTEDSKEYKDYEESAQKQKSDRIIDIDDNLSENLFSSAINFGVFKEFPSINYNKNTSNINNNQKNNLNSIEENEFEEHCNNYDNYNENYDNSQEKDNLTIQDKTEEKIKLSEQSLNNRNSLMNNQMNFTQTQNARNSISKTSFNESSKNNYFFALNSLEKKLSKDDLIQQELNALNEKFLNVGNKKKIKGLKFDKDIHIDFYELMKSFLSKDLKNDVDIGDFSYNEMMRKKVINENVIYKINNLCY